MTPTAAMPSAAETPLEVKVDSLSETIPVTIASNTPTMTSSSSGIVKRAALIKNPFDTISPPNRTISNFDAPATFASGSQQNFVLSDVALSQVSPLEDGGIRGGAAAAAARTRRAGGATVEQHQRIPGAQGRL